MKKVDLVSGRWLVFLLILFAVALPPIVKNNYIIHIGAYGCLLAIQAVSLNLVFGYTGQMSLAQGAFWGIGAYASALLVLRLGINYWFSLVLGVLLVGLIGFLLAVSTSRVKGIYFGIVTLAFNLVVTILAENLDRLTGGTTGLPGVPPSSPIGPINFNSIIAKYYLNLFFLFLCILFTYRLMKSLVGRTYIAIRESEDLTQAVGINVTLDKIKCFTIAAAMAGLAGVLNSSFTGLVSPSTTSFFKSVDSLIYCVVGGVGTMIGPLVGTFSLLIISELAQAMPSLVQVINGAVLILFILFLPSGIIGGIWVLRERMSGAKGG
jgi:branched-chain amino acid transport system permease protein